MSRLNGRLKKLERKDAPYERISAIIHRIVRPGKNGPVYTGHAIAVIPGLNAPQVIKSLDETYEKFSARIDKLSLQAKGIDEMSGDALQAAIDALGEVIAEMNRQAEIDNAE
jgi:hypothetical protein